MRRRLGNLSRTKTVTFWYKTESNPIKIVIGVRECKQPERTREWKRLVSESNYGYGWSVGTPEEVFFGDEYKYEDK